MQGRTKIRPFLSHLCVSLSDREDNFENLEVANKAGAANRLWILRYFHLQLYLLTKSFNETTEAQSTYQYKKTHQDELYETHQCKVDTSHRKS